LVFGVLRPCQDLLDYLEAGGISGTKKKAHKLKAACALVKAEKKR